MKDLEINGSTQTALDVIRIIAAYFVLIGHSFSFYQLTVLKNDDYFPYIQNIAVVVFFLLSGFLTVYSLERKQKEHYSFMDFFKHKLQRIMREYIPGLCFIALTDLIAINCFSVQYAYYEGLSIRQFLGNALMLQNMGPQGVLGKWVIPFGSGRPLWTISIEWWFYLLFAALYLLIHKKIKKSIINILIVVFLIFMSCGYWINGRGNGLGIVFMLGVLGYYVFRRLTRKWACFMCIFSIVGYAYFSCYNKDAYNIISIILIWLLFVSIVCLVDSCSSERKRNKIIAFISGSTFSLYLIHYSIIDLLFRLLTDLNILLRFWMGIVLSVLSSICLYCIFGRKNFKKKKS